MTNEPNYKQILIDLGAGAYLADHMGDMADDIFDALVKAKIITLDESRTTGDLNELRELLLSKYPAKEETQ